MRCPTCGTDNETDSRFCGGCGARIGQQAPSRLAPTHKIHDDAPYPQQSAQPAVMPSGPVSYAPPSIPPASAQRSAQLQPPPASIATPAPGSLVRPASQPAAPQSPSSQSLTSRRPASQPPRVAPQPQPSASASFALPPRRPIGLMVALLIVDLGLAAAGAVLLSKGLADDDATSDAKAEPAAVDTKKSEAPIESAAPAQAAAAPAPTPAAAAAPAPAPAAAAPTSTSRPTVAAAAPAAAVPAARKDATKQRDDKKLTATKAAVPVASGPVTSPTAITPSDKPSGDAKLVTAVPSEPQDPYSEAGTEREIDAAAARSKPIFDRCATDHGPLQGKVEIAFQVRPDGRVANAAAVENSTGNSELARCLIAEISSWRVSAHQGAALNMSRPFTYR